ncbi:hypothetical protein IEO21_02072 [Rhodonia placenta]|uniref:Uncharacterized protein n=1 Tax=Rhodonia placenta TaxID=104341 RepID=A0A8H7P899_9APHY|nr:hypothetical protein IEO21_02072 [Postia placenta]
MSLKRYSTVHDLSALRLHPDGSRVQNRDANRSLRKANYVALDARGNWIARDAGGIGAVKVRRTVRTEEDENSGNGQCDHGEEFELKDDSSSDGSEYEAGPSRKSRAKGKRKAGHEPKGTRAHKRRRFHEDYSFLGNTTSAQVPTDDTNALSRSGSYGQYDGLAELPVPSSDLLKCVHYFATTYYTAMGQLYDASREARQQKRLRRLQRLRGRPEGNRDQSEEPGTANTEHGHASDDVENDVDVEDEDREESGGDEDEDEDEDADGKATRRWGHSRSRRDRPTKVDMYKIFDGSALMALGMLVQEHIAQMFSGDVPEEWEAAMQAEEAAQEHTQGGKRRRRSRGHKSKDKSEGGVFGSDEEDETTDEEGASEAADDRIEMNAEANRRRTRGVVLPLDVVPYGDEDSDDEDFVPESD